MVGLIWDLIGRDNASPANLKAAGSFDKLAMASTKASTSQLEANRIANRLKIAELQVAAATERHAAVANSATASISRQAGAQIALIRSNQSLAEAQAASAAASRASVVAANGSTSGLKNAVKMASSLGLLIGGIELGKKAIEFIGAGKDLTTSLNGVQAAARATDAQMVPVRAQVIAMGKDMTIPAATAVDAADAINDLVRAGIALPKAMLAARPALLLASAAQTDTAFSARILGDVLDEFMLPGEKAGQIANYLAGGATAAGGGLTAMFDAMKYVGPRARAVGLGVDDIVAAIADLSKAGIQGSIAGTGLAMMLQKLSHESGPGQKALDDLGVSAFTAEGKFKGLPSVIGQLHDAQQRFGKDNKRFLADISVAFGARAANVVAAFAGKGVEGYNHMLKMVRSGNVEEYAARMNRGVGAALRQANKTFTAIGIDAYQGAEPWLDKLVRFLTSALPAGFAIVQAAADPFVTIWHGLGSVLGGPLSLLGDLLGLLAPLAPVLGGTAAAALAMFAAFKGAQLVQAGIYAVMDGVAILGANVRNAAASTVAGFSAMTTSTSTTGSIMMAEFAAIEAAAMQHAATEARAAAMVAVAEADKAAASTAATDVMVANADLAAAAALANARTAAVAAAETVAAADLAAAGVAEAGTVARIGWASMLGPLAAVGIGLTFLVGMFHKSDGASKQATESAKAYTDALASGGTAAQKRAEVVDTAMTKLKDNGAVEAMNKVNDAQKSGIVTGDQLVTAITKRGTAYDTLKGKLQDVVKTETRYKTQGAVASNVGGPPASYLTERGKAAQKLIDQLGVQSSALSKATAKELDTAKAFHVTATSIDQVSQTSQVGSETAKKYAAMMGIVVDKNGVAAVSAKTLNSAINTVSTAYGRATATGAEYLQAVAAFSQSQGTAADRATLIGATLKAANGDALAYAGSMNSATTAGRQFGKNIESAADQAKKGVRSYIGAFVDLKTGTINYSKSAAGPFISDLQSMQTAAMGAAQATFQHARATMSGKQAADRAYQVYVAQTRGQFLDTEGHLTKQARQAGLTEDAAKGLANQYFGMPKDVKTQIEQIGADPVVTILDKIGAMLARLTGQKWTPTVGVNDQATPAITNIKAYLDTLHNRTLTVTVQRNEKGVATGRQVGNPATTSGAKAGGGIIHGPGTGTSDDVLLRASNGEFVTREKMTRKHRGLLEAINNDRIPAYAKGGVVGEVHKDGKGWVYEGKYYVTKAGAEKARAQDAYNASHTQKAASGVYRVGRGYGYEGQYYDSAKDANSARRDSLHQAAAAARYHSPDQRATVATDTNAYRAAIRSGDINDTRSAYATLYADARAAGASRKALDALTKSQRTVIADLQRRAVATARVAKVTDYLTDLQSKAADLRTSVQGAFKSGFDITQSAPQMFNDVAGGGTAGGILKSITAYADKAAGYRTLLTTLAKKGLNPTLLQQLAEAGPTTEAFNAATALGAATPAELSGINAQYKRIDVAGAGAGSIVSTAVFGTQISVAQALLNGYSPKKNPAMGAAVKALSTQMFGAGAQTGAGLVQGLLGQQKAAGNAASKLGTQVAASLRKSLGIHSPSRVTRQLGLFTGAGFVLGLQDSVRDVARASDDLGSAVGPSAAPTGGGGGGGDVTINHHWNITEAGNPYDTAAKVARRVAMSGP